MEYVSVVLINYNILLRNVCGEKKNMCIDFMLADFDEKNTRDF